MPEPKMSESVKFSRSRPEVREVYVVMQEIYDKDWDYTGKFIDSMWDTREIAEEYIAMARRGGRTVVLEVHKLRG